MRWIGGGGRHYYHEEPEMRSERCHCDGVPGALPGATEAIYADGWAAYQVDADCFTSLRFVRNDSVGCFAAVRLTIT